MAAKDVTEQGEQGAKRVLRGTLATCRTCFVPGSRPIFVATFCERVVAGIVCGVRSAKGVVQEPAQRGRT